MGAQLLEPGRDALEMAVGGTVLQDLDTMLLIQCGKGEAGEKSNSFKGEMQRR